LEPLLRLYWKFGSVGSRVIVENGQNWKS
jgi:hypothetical protein